MRERRGEYLVWKLHRWNKIDFVYEVEKVDIKDMKFIQFRKRGRYST
jgi:hypothetical protein